MQAPESGPQTMYEANQELNKKKFLKHQEEQLAKRRLLSEYGSVFIPGVSPGQPFKENHFRYCYKILKTASTQRSLAGDHFDTFLWKAEDTINNFNPIIPRKSKENPFDLRVAFDIVDLEEEKFEEIKVRMKEQNKITIDKMLVFEGCESDDKILLAGRKQFLSHFCTLFNFNICYSYQEQKIMEKKRKDWDDGDYLTNKIEQYMKSFDEIK